MNIFVTGATGYIGFNIAKTFRREGYQVFGLAQDKDKIKKLARNEIIPIIGWLKKSDSYERVAENCDLIIQAEAEDFDSMGSEKTQATKKLVEITLNSSQPKRMLYSSGIWVYGNSRVQSLSETSSLGTLPIVSSASESEQVVLNGNGIVIRSGFIYGKEGGVTGDWFKGASNGGVIKIIGEGLNRWPMIHIDDLAEGYLLAAKSRYQGEVFNLVDSSKNTVLEMASAAAKIAGNIHQIEFLPKDEAINEFGPKVEILTINQLVDATKAHRMLGWVPKHKGFIQEVGTYFRAWDASEEK